MALTAVGPPGSGLRISWKAKDVLAYPASSQRVGQIRLRPPRFHFSWSPTPVMTSKRTRERGSTPEQELSATHRRAGPTGKQCERELGNRDPERPPNPYCVHRGGRAAGSWITRGSHGRRGQKKSEPRQGRRWGREHVSRCMEGRGAAQSQPKPVRAEFRIITTLVCRRIPARHDEMDPHTPQKRSFVCPSRLVSN